MTDDRDILDRLLEPKPDMTAFEQINLRESAAVEIQRLRDLNDKYRKALEVINGSADWLISRQAAGALDNIGPEIE